MANERPPMRMMGRGGPPPHERMLMAEKPKNTKGTLKRLVGYIGKNRYLMILLLSVMLIITVLNLVAPYLQGLAIDKITVSNQRLNVDISGMLYCLIALGCVYLVNSLLTYFQGIFAAKLSQTTVKAMRKDLFDKRCREYLKHRFSVDSLAVFRCSDACRLPCVYALLFAYADACQPYICRSDACCYKESHKVYEKILPVTADAFRQT